MDVCRLCHDEAVLLFSSSLNFDTAVAVIQTISGFIGYLMYISAYVKTTGTAPDWLTNVSLDRRKTTRFSGFLSYWQILEIDALALGSKA